MWLSFGDHFDPPQAHDKSAQLPGQELGPLTWLPAQAAQGGTRGAASLCSVAFPSSAGQPCSEERALT